ncbi:MAG TPA: hypothetical protein VKP68_03420 [Ramlibacter sp.]|nr:hypothetical protein [Ramlibacter sp.]
MKLQTLLIAVAMIAGGSAFAASDTAPVGDTTAQPTAGAPHKAKSTKTQHKAHHAKTSHKGTHHAKASTHHKDASTHHMGASGHHMNAAATPSTDVTARDRQGRVDDAYAKWKANQR